MVLKEVIMDNDKKKPNILLIILIIVLGIILIWLAITFFAAGMINDTMDTAQKSSCCQANGGIWRNNQCVAPEGWTGQAPSTTC